MKTKRQTGRTTRMLDAAMAAARDGRAVYVVAANADHARTLRAIAGACGGDNLGIKFEPIGNFRELDLRTGAARFAAHPNCAFFIDHYAVETGLAWALREMTRFDLPEESE